MNFIESLNGGVWFYPHEMKCPAEVKYPAEWWQGYLIFNCFHMQENGKCEYSMQKQLLYFIICGRYFKINKTLKKKSVHI